MRNFFEPATAPLWLKDTLRSVRGALTDIWPAPLRLWRAATADLPAAASDNEGGMVWDADDNVVKWSDGAAWVRPSLSTHTHSEADINLAATDRLVGRDMAGAGPAEELIVGGGLEFTGSGGIQRSALSGDVTASAGSGVTIIANGAVTFAKLEDLASDRLIGRDTAGTGDPEAISVGGGLEFTGSGGIRRSALSGDVTAGAGSDATAIADDAVTYAKMQNVSATDRLLGRASAGAGDVEEISCTAAGRSLIAATDAQAQRVLLRSACMVKKSASETGINASAGGHFLSWDSEVHDDGGYHDNFANNSRLTTLSGQTRVRVGCTIAFANVTASSQVSVAIYRNGSAAYDGRTAINQTSPSSALQPTLSFASGPIPITGGTDYFQVGIYCSDTSIDVTNSSNFWIEGC